jgi:hypothetical protein
MTPKNESMFRLDSFHAPYFENEWAKPKWLNIKVVEFKVYYNWEKIWSKKQLRFGSKGISKLTTRIDSIVSLVFWITKKIENASFFTKNDFNILQYVVVHHLRPTSIDIVKFWQTNI